MLGVHVLPEERLVSDELFQVMLKSSAVTKYINNFALNMKKNIGKAMKNVRTAVLPLLPQDVVQKLKEFFDNQSYRLSYIDDLLIEEIPNLRKLQIYHEREPG